VVSAESQFVQGIMKAGLALVLGGPSDVIIFVRLPLHKLHLIYKRLRRSPEEEEEGGGGGEKVGRICFSEICL
jgi:hypothetical protein